VQSEKNHPFCGRILIIFFIFPQTWGIIKIRMGSGTGACARPFRRCGDGAAPLKILLGRQICTVKIGGMMQ
jgi:hypothetical protein